MELIKFTPLGMFAVNSYAIVSDKNNAVIIDAPSGAEAGLKLLNNKGITVKKILLTHGHCDHIECLAYIAEKAGAEVYIHEADEPKLSDNNLNQFYFFADAFDTENLLPVKNAVKLHDGDVITLDEIEIKVMHTPGHTSGGVCYFAGNMIFSGDTLFAGSIGRTDMPDGDMSALKNSLEKLALLDKKYDSFKVYPGHGAYTTIAREKMYNPYLKGINYDNLFYRQQL
jgi:glyoxylase-like metal-dependent hydrolase (beta-lactamase superfamily II)